jgi:hypothetical protein
MTLLSLDVFFYNSFIGDGIFDKLSNREVVNCVWKTVLDQKANDIHE